MRLFNYSLTNLARVIKARNLMAYGFAGDHGKVTENILNILF
jgi:hypothetical protein